MYKKINKVTAKKMFLEGIAIRLATSKVNPMSMFGVTIRKTTEETEQEFDKKINEFAYYNCNAELGQRVCYYVE